MPDLNVAVLNIGKTDFLPEKVRGVSFCKTETRCKQHSFDLLCKQSDNNIEVYADCSNLSDWEKRLNEYDGDIRDKQHFKQLCECDGAIVFEKRGVQKEGALGGICLAVASSGTIDYTVLAIVTDVFPPYYDDNSDTKRLFRAMKMSKILQCQRDAKNFWRHLRCLISVFSENFSHTHTYTRV